MCALPVTMTFNLLTSKWHRVHRRV